MNEVSLPLAEWTVKQAALHGNVFLLLTAPGQEPRVLGRTADHRLFVRELTGPEKAVVG